MADARQPEFEAIFEAMPLALIVEDSQRRIRRVNRVFISMFGYRNQQWEHQSSRVLYADSGDFDSQGERVFRQQPEAEYQPYERRYRRQDGSFFWGETVTAVIRDDAGRPTGYLKLIRDITSRLNSQRELDDSQRQLGSSRKDLSDSRTELSKHATRLEKANEELEQFAYIASHDLKQPLRGIQMLVQWIVEECGEDLPSSAQQHLATLAGRVERLEKMLDDLLAYSRVDKQGVVPEWVCPSDCVDEIGGLLDPAEDYEVTYDGDLIWIKMDRSALELILRNLIGNAIKHHDRPRGRVTVTATVLAAEQSLGSADAELPQQVELRVSDDGPGIEQPYRNRIFEFFQTLKPRDQVDGSGMGLAIIRKLVLAQSGTVFLEPTEGRGSVFVVRLPCLGVRVEPE